MLTDLPNNLKIPSNIRYIQGTSGVWEPEFESDFDKAIYYAGKSPNPRSKSQKNIVEWLFSIGISFEEIKDHRKKILKKLKQLTNRDGAWDDYPNVLVPPVFQSFNIEQDEDEEDENLEGLDDLLNSLKDDVKEEAKEEGGRGGALALRPKVQETGDDQLMGNETIDQRILDTLGIVDGSDLTYGEYKSLLRAKMIEDRMSSTSMSTSMGPTDDIVGLVVDEYKRVKNLTGSFRIKAKVEPTRITADTIRKRSPIASLSQVMRPPGRELPESVEVKRDKELDDISENLSDLDDLLREVRDDFAKDLKERKEEDKIEDQQRLQEQRDKKEEEAEKRPRSVSLPKISIPNIPIPFFDRIKKFFGNILAGSVLLGLFKWINDEENRKKLIEVKDWVIDKMPLIVAAIAGFVAINLGLKIIKFLKDFLDIITRIRRGLKRFWNLAKKVLKKLPKPDKPSDPPKPPPTPVLSNQQLGRVNASQARFIQGTSNIGDRLRLLNRGYINPGQLFTRGGFNAQGILRDPLSFMSKLKPSNITMPNISPGLVGGVARGTTSFGLSIGLSMLMDAGFQNLSDKRSKEIIMKKLEDGATPDEIRTEIEDLLKQEEQRGILDPQKYTNGDKVDRLRGALKVLDEVVKEREEKPDNTKSDATITIDNSKEEISNITEQQTKMTNMDEKSTFQIANNSISMDIKPPVKGREPSIISLTGGGSGGPTSAATPSQKKVPTFSSYNPNDFRLPATASIYNLV